MKKSLTCKIELWNKMSDMMFQIENRSSGTLNLVSIVSIIISTISLIFGDSKGNVQYVLKVLYIVMPLIIVISLISLSYDNRVAAIIKGYLAGVEDSINRELGKCVYQYNIFYPWFYSRKYFLTNYCIGVFYVPVVIVLTVLCFYKIYTLAIIPLAAEIAYFVFYMGLVVASIKDLATNPITRKMARAHFHELERLSQVDYKKMDLKEFLDFRLNLDTLIKKFDINNE